ncbi:MAG: GNAT family N-acetyltransferase [Tissierellia bacterium]|nr:GNAT family N-acetyltransferase [Tissierellia bacterium]
MEIRGERITIRTLKLEDAYYMNYWGKHENPLLFDYNIPPLTKEEIGEWYHYKIQKDKNRYYGIFNEEDKLIGYLGIKRIRKLFRDSLLGIVLDPNHINKGYGTEAILTFLDFYFNEMGMNKMYLEVAQFNKRAIRCYEKCGFKIIDRYLDEFFNQELDLKDPHFLEESSSFVIIRGRIYNYIYKMKVDRKRYLKAREEIENEKARDKIRPTTV